MILKEYEPEPMPLHEAEENLRVIRDLMERSTRYSTFSGLSGVSAGLVSIIGCLVQKFWVIGLPAASQPAAFLLTWSIVVVLAIGMDFVLTKRRAPLVGKTINSHLGRQMFVASFPALFTGALLTLFFLRNGLIDNIYPFWMLAYGIAVGGVGQFSQPEVSRLSRGFLAAGTLTFLLSYLPLGLAAGSVGLVMTAVSFGGFHILYGLHVSRRGGW
jgi:hypothetical protein